MGLANVVNEQQEPSSILFKEENYDKIDERIDFLKGQSRKKLLEQGFKDENIDYELYLNLRYNKTDFAIMVKPFVVSKTAPYCSQCNFEQVSYFSFLCCNVKNYYCKFIIFDYYYSRLSRGISVNLASQ